MSLSTDLYQLTMMAAYDAAGVRGESAFELFVRDLPPRRSFLVVAGIEQALEYLERLRFEPDEVAFLRALPGLQAVPDRFFDEVLPALRFTGDVWSMAEGEVVFAHEPILRVAAPAMEAQLVETALLTIVNFQTSIASKAARVVAAAEGRPVVEFGSRRAHGLDAALHAARAAYVAGCAGTSNVEAGYRFGIPLFGTMAHSWVMTFDDEVEAFRRYMDVFGRQTTILIDTYDTVEAARKIVAAGLRPAAVRLDSGDLASLSRAVRRVLDEGGLTETTIFGSGDLDEYKVAALVRAGAPIDAFGVGTALSTSVDAPALGGVYKLVETVRDGHPYPTLKLSAGKRTYPGRKQVWRAMESGRAVHDVLGLERETGQTGRPLLAPVMREGRRLGPVPALTDTRVRVRHSIGELAPDLRGLDAGDTYQVHVSPALDALARQAQR